MPRLDGKGTRWTRRRTSRGGQWRVENRALPSSRSSALLDCDGGDGIVNRRTNGCTSHFFRCASPIENMLGASTTTERPRELVGVRSGAECRLIVT